MTYKPATLKEGNKYYGGVQFVSPTVCDTYFIDLPQDTREKARAIAKRKIEEIKAKETK
jgi:hypothetical protein